MVVNFPLILKGTFDRKYVQNIFISFTKVGYYDYSFPYLSISFMIESRYLLCSVWFLVYCDFNSDIKANVEFAYPHRGILLNLHSMFSSLYSLVFDVICSFSILSAKVYYVKIAFPMLIFYRILIFMHITIWCFTFYFYDVMPSIFKLYCDGVFCILLCQIHLILYPPWLMAEFERKR